MSRAGAAFAPLAIAVRRLRADLPFAAALFAVVAATAFLFALVPQVFDHMAEQSLEEAVAAADPLERDVELTRAGRIAPGSESDPLAPVTAAGAAYEQRLAPSVRSVLGEPRAAFETLRYTIVTPPREAGPAGTVRYLTLRSLGDAPEHLAAVAGRMPGGEGGVVHFPFTRQRSGPHVEIALSQETAAQLSVGLDDLVYLFPALDDPLVQGVPTSDQGGLAATVSALMGSDDAAWFRDSRLARAATRDTETARYVYAYGYVSGEAYDDLAAATRPLPLRYEWRYLVDPAAFDASNVERFTADVRRIDTEFGQTTYGQTLGLGARTGLTRILDRYAADRDAAEAVLAVGGISFLAVALTVLGLLAALAAERRAPAIELLRSRGGSLGQVLAAQAGEGLLVALPAGAVGLLVAALVTPGPARPLSAWLALGIVAAAAALLAGFAVGPARRALTARARDEVAVARLSPPRLGLEVAAALASLAGAYLLRRRGLSAEGGFDLYLAAVPLLVGVAVGLLALRLYPLPLRALAWAASGRRDLAPALGLRRIARQPPVAAAPLLVVLLATSVGVFAAALAATIGDAQAQGGGLLSPLDTGTRRTFEAGVAVAGLYAAAALALAPVLTGRPRLRDLTYLRALGLSRRETLGLAAVELAPPVLAALALGVALGLGVAYLVEPGLDLVPLGRGAEAPVRPDPLAPAVLAGALLVVSACAALVTGAVAARADVSRALRMGER
jgi:putative ABC transport system permease protein